MLRLFLAGLMLVGLPLAGVALSGRDVRQYCELPPLTHYVAHAPFRWSGFAWVLGLDLLLVLGLAWAVHRGWRATRGAAAPALRGRFPWWGWAGAALTSVAWVLAWNRFAWFAPLQRHTFTPLWLGYILVVNGLCWQRRGCCPLTGQPVRFVFLFGASALFWWFFEYLNRFVQNWYYLGVERFSAPEYVLLASVSFSTVLPAVYSTCELLRTWPALDRGLQGQAPLRTGRPRRRALAALAVAALGLTLIGVWPDTLFPLLWVSPLLILLSEQVLAGQPTLLNGLAAGDWRNLVVPPLAALVCGWFWEMWNVASLAKWEYAVPFVDRFHVFEMPVVGYGGYLPFGLECLLICELVYGRAPASAVSQS
jgi:hypothetical protein